MMRRLLPRLIPAAALLALLVGCDDDPPKTEQRIPAYASFDACVAATKDDGSKTHTPSECFEAFRAATDAHLKTAPKYASREACETAGHSCTSRHDQGSDVFMPLLAGVVIGNMLANGQRQSTPIYVDRNNAAYSGGTRLGTARDCRTDGSCRGGGGFIGSTGGAASSPVWSSGSYGATTYTAPHSSSSWGSKPSAIAPGATARGGFGASASSAATSSGG